MGAPRTREARGHNTAHFSLEVEESAVVLEDVYTDLDAYHHLENTEQMLAYRPLSCPSASQRTGCTNTRSNVSRLKGRGSGIRLEDHSDPPHSARHSPHTHTHSIPRHQTQSDPGSSTCPAPACSAGRERRVGSFHLGSSHTARQTDTHWEPEKW